MPGYYGRRQSSWSHRNKKFTNKGDLKKDKRTVALVPVAPPSRRVPNAPRAVKPFRASPRKVTSSFNGVRDHFGLMEYPHHCLFVLRKSEDFKYFEKHCLPMVSYASHKGENFKFDKNFDPLKIEMSWVVEPSSGEALFRYFNTGETKGLMPLGKRFDPSRHGACPLFPSIHTIETEFSVSVGSNTYNIPKGVDVFYPVEDGKEPSQEQLISFASDYMAKQYEFSVSQESKRKAALNPHATVPRITPAPLMLPAPPTDVQREIKEIEDKLKLAQLKEKLRKLESKSETVATPRPRRLDSLDHKHNLSPVVPTPESNPRFSRDGLDWGDDDEPDSSSASIPATSATIFVRAVGSGELPG